MRRASPGDRHQVSHGERSPPPPHESGAASQVIDPFARADAATLPARRSRRLETELNAREV
jgi:hypothetical protein